MAEVDIVRRSRVIALRIKRGGKRLEIVAVKQKRDTNIKIFLKITTVLRNTTRKKAKTSIMMIMKSARNRFMKQREKGTLSISKSITVMNGVIMMRKNTAGDKMNGRRRHTKKNTGTSNTRPPRSAVVMKAKKTVVEGNIVEAMSDIARKVEKVGVGMRAMKADRRLRVKITLSMNAIMVEMLNRTMSALTGKVKRKRSSNGAGHHALHLTVGVGAEAVVEAMRDLRTRRRRRISIDPDQVGQGLEPMKSEDVVALVGQVAQSNQR